MSFSPILGPEIPAFQRADAPPPPRVWAFFGWALKGAWAGIIWASFWSVLVGSLEAISATLLGRIIDGVAGDQSRHDGRRSGAAVCGVCVVLPGDQAGDLWDEHRRRLDPAGTEPVPADPEPGASVDHRAGGDVFRQ